MVCGSLTSQQLWRIGLASVRYSRTVAPTRTTACFGPSGHAILWEVATTARTDVTLVVPGEPTKSAPTFRMGTASGQTSLQWECIAVVDQSYPASAR